MFSAAVGFFSGVFSTAWAVIRNIFAPVTSFFQGIWNSIVNTVSGIGIAVGNAISGAVRGAVNGVLHTAESAINGFINVINGAIGVINNIPGVKIPHIGNIHFGRLAKGTEHAAGGQYLVGENGPEMVTLPRGSKVMPAQRTANLLDDNRGKGDININIDAKIYKDTDAYQLASRIGYLVSQA